MGRDSNKHSDKTRGHRHRDRQRHDHEGDRDDEKEGGVELKRKRKVGERDEYSDGGGGGARRRHRQHHRDRDREVDRRKDRKHRRKREDGDDDSGSDEDRKKRSKKKHRRRRSRDDNDEDGSDSESNSDSEPSRDKKKKNKKDKKKKSSPSSSSHRIDHKEGKKRKKDGRGNMGSDDDDDEDADQNGPKINPPDRSTIIPMGDKYGRAPSTKLDPEKDYFSYHQQFWVYLYREEGIAFNDLNTKQAHSAFNRFVKRYNSGDLEVPYYSEGLPDDVIEEAKTTKHSWNFRTSEKEREGLEALQVGVRRQTEFNRNPNSNQLFDPIVKTVESGARYGAVVPSRPSDNHIDRPTQTEVRQEQRSADRRLKEQVQLSYEELTGIGKQDYRERQLEKKRQQSEQMHGAAREKGEGEVLDDGALYGDDDRSSFKSALEREKRQDDQKREQRQNRIVELQKREEERKNNMLKMLGLEGVKEKIKIAPRKEGE